MDAKEFIITKFERNYPTLVNLIDFWTEHSIVQNWDCVKVILNEFNIPDCPPQNEFNAQGERKTFVYLNEICNRVTEYFIAKGFKRVVVSSPVTLFSPYKTHIRGHCVAAYFTAEEKDNFKPGK